MSVKVETKVGADGTLEIKDAVEEMDEVISDEPKKPEKTEKKKDEKKSAPKQPVAETVDPDTMLRNRSHCARPKVELKNGETFPLTRKLLKEISGYDIRGNALSNRVEEQQKVDRLTKMLDQWEAGEFI